MEEAKQRMVRMSRNMGYDVAHDKTICVHCSRCGKVIWESDSDEKLGLIGFLSIPFIVMGIMFLTITAVIWLPLMAIIDRLSDPEGYKAISPPDYCDDCAKIVGNDTAAKVARRSRYSPDRGQGPQATSPAGGPEYLADLADEESEGRGLKIC